MFRRYQLMLFLVLLFGAEWVPSAYAEINDVSIGGVVQSQPDSEAQLVSKRARRRAQRQNARPCGGYLYEESAKPDTMVSKMLMVVGGLANLGRKVSLLAGLLVIASGVMQYRKHLENPVQTRLIYAITTMFAGIALLFLGWLQVAHVEAIVW
jgi:hypothetical protein